MVSSLIIRKPARILCAVQRDGTQFDPLLLWLVGPPVAPAA
jgi:hypothetical protein